MAISDDWSFDYVGKELRHIDGVLSYDGNTGTAPALNDYVIGTTSGAVGRVIAGSDLGGTSATGTLTLTNVSAGGATGAESRFQDNEALRVLSEIAFDTIGGTPQGFTVGDTLTGPTTETIDVQFVEYNQGPKVTLAGEGSIYGDNLTTGWINNEQIDVSATAFGRGDASGATAVALVNTGAETDNSGLFTTCLVNGTIAVPGTANTNNSVIVHYDGGTIAIPEDAKISDTTTGAIGFAQQVVGVLATGSVRLVDSDTTGGAWTDNNGIDLEDVVFYNVQVAGEVFLEGSQYEGQTSGFRFRVLAVIDDGDSTGKLITAGKNGGLTLNEDVHRILAGDVLGNKIAQVENTTTVLATGASLNLPGGVRTEQRTYQGGVFGSSVSLNIRRSANALFSYVQDTLDELGQLDDDPILAGTFRDNVYELLDGNGWEIPDLSFRFLEKGGFTDTSANNVWTNDQSVMSRVVPANGFLPTASAPRPHPNAYMEQGSKVREQFWLEGDFNAIIKVKSTTSVVDIAAATPALGQLIDGGNRLWYNRELGDSYDHFPSSQVGGVATIPLTTAADADNQEGEYRYSFNTGGAGAFTVGEEITATTAGVLKVGVVTLSGTGTTGNVDYILKSPTDFADTDVITGAVSAKSATLDGAGQSNLIAGYGTNIRTMVQDTRFTGGTTITATFIVGEIVSQAVSGYDGYFLEDDGGSIYCQDVPGTAAPNATGALSGDTSGANNTPTATNDQATVPKDMGDGSGDLDYSGVSGGDITGASAQTVQKIYEWDKYLVRKESTTLFGGVGVAVGVEGRIYRGFVATFTESKSAPLGTFAGGTMTGAQGHFIDKDTLVVADLQKMVSVDNAGTPVFPPDLQPYLISNVAAGWRCGGYRSTGAGSTAILTTEFQIGAGNATGNSVIVVQAGTRGVGPLPNDVPNTGVLRVEDPSVPGIFLRAIYDSVNRATNTFSLQQGIGQNTIGDITGAVALTQGDNSFVAFIEKEAVGASISNNVQRVGDIDCVTRARKKGFKHFIAAGVFGSAGLSQGVVQTPDPSVNLP